MTVHALEVLRLEIDTALNAVSAPLFVRDVLPGIDVPSPALIYQFVCTLMGSRLLSSSFNIAVQAVARARSLSEGGTLHSHYPQRISHDSGRVRQRGVAVRRSIQVYVDQPDWIDSVCYTGAKAVPSLRQISKVTLLPLSSSYHYVDGALLPGEAAPYVDNPILVDLPRTVEAGKTTWGQYVVVRGRSYYRGTAWVDPQAPRWHNRHRAVFWLSLAG